MKKAKTIFFDLDGTLIDIADKYFRIYADFASQKDIPYRSKNDFWRLKRKKAPVRDLFKTSISESEYKDFFLSQVETREYLKYDRLFLFTLPTLRQLKKMGWGLCLLTLRRNNQNLRHQLDNLGLNFFDKIIVGEPDNQASRNNYKRKIACITALVEPEDIIVGDSAADMLCGKHLKLITVGVLSGISSYKALKKNTPTFIIRNISSLTKKKIWSFL